MVSGGDATNTNLQQRRQLAACETAQTDKCCLQCLKNLDKYVCRDVVICILINHASMLTECCNSEIV